MRSIAFFFCFLAAARLSVLCAPIQSQHAAVVARKNAGGGGPSYLVDEGFEGSGAPSGWTVSKGSPNWDYTTSPLVGTESLFLGGKTAGDDVRVQTATFTSAGAIEIYTQFRLESFDSIGTASFVTVKHGTTVLATCSFSTAKIRIQVAGGSAADTVTTLSASTVYHLWVRYVPGSGGDAAATAAFSTDGTRPASGNAHTSSSSGTATANADRFDVYGEYIGGTNRYDIAVDRVLASTSAIGDNP